MGLFFKMFKSDGQEAISRGLIGWKEAILQKVCAYMYLCRHMCACMCACMSL